MADAAPSPRRTARRVSADDVEMAPLRRPALEASPSESQPTAPRTCGVPARVLGLTFMALSAVMFSLMTLVVHMLRTSFSPFMIASVRFAINLAVASVTVAAQRPEHGLLGPPSQRLLLTARAVIGAVAMSLVFVAVTQLPVGDANAIIFTNPVVTAVLAAIVLREAFGWLEGLALLLGFGGVVLVVRPEFIFGPVGPGEAPQRAVDTLFELTYPEAVACAVASSLLSACAYLSVRALAAPGRPKVSSAVVVAWFAVAGLVIAPSVAFATGQGFQAPPDVLSVVGLLAVGLLGFAGQWLLNNGLMLEKAGPATAMRNLDVVLAFVYQAVLGEAVTWWAVSGAVVVCVATLLVAWGKMRGGSNTAAASADRTDSPISGRHDAAAATARQEPAAEENAACHDPASSSSAAGAQSGADRRSTAPLSDSSDSDGEGLLRRSPDAGTLPRLLDGGTSSSLEPLDDTEMRVVV